MFVYSCGIGNTLSILSWDIPSFRSWDFWLNKYTLTSYALFQHLNDPFQHADTTVLFKLKFLHLRSRFFLLNFILLSSILSCMLFWKLIIVRASALHHCLDPFLLETALSTKQWTLPLILTDLLKQLGWITLLHSTMPNFSKFSSSLDISNAIYMYGPITICAKKYMKNGW